MIRFFPTIWQVWVGKRTITVELKNKMEIAAEKAKCLLLFAQLKSVISVQRVQASLWHGSTLTQVHHEVVWDVRNDCLHRPQQEQWADVTSRSFRTSDEW